MSITYVSEAHPPRPHVRAVLVGVIAMVGFSWQVLPAMRSPEDSRPSPRLGFYHVHDGTVIQQIGIDAAHY